MAYELVLNDSPNPKSKITKKLGNAEDDDDLFYRLYRDDNK